jgi:hypothetical protein
VLFGLTSGGFQASLFGTLHLDEGKMRAAAASSWREAGHSVRCCDPWSDYKSNILRRNSSGKISTGLYMFALFVGALLLLGLPRTVDAICPNSCSGHGLCSAGTVCSCYTGWSGGAADCSMS